MPASQRSDTPTPQQAAAMSPPANPQLGSQSVPVVTSALPAAEIRLEISVTTEKQDILMNTTQPGKTATVKAGDKFQIHTRAIYFRVSEKEHQYDFEIWRVGNNTRTRLMTGYKEAQPIWTAVKLHPGLPLDPSYTVARSIHFDPLEPGHYEFSVFSWNTAERQAIKAKYASADPKKLAEELEKTECSRVGVTFQVKVNP